MGYSMGLPLVKITILIRLPMGYKNIAWKFPWDPTMPFGDSHGMSYDIFHAI